jgi:hypothetical protein
VYLSFCSFQEYEGLLFYIDSTSTAYLLRLVGCYLNGTCPTAVTNAAEFDTALVKENAILTVTIRVITTRNCRVLYLLTGQFTPSNELPESDPYASESIDFSKSNSFDETVKFSYSIVPTETHFLTKSNHMVPSDYLTESLALGSSINLEKTSGLSTSNPPSVSANFPPSNSPIPSENVAESEALSSSDLITSSSSHSETLVFNHTSEHSATADPLATHAFDNSNEWSFSGGSDKTQHFSATNSFLLTNELTSAMDAVLPPTDLPADTVAPPSTVVIDSGQTYPPTVSPIATVPPASLKATRSDLSASTIPPASTFSPPPTVVIDSGQTYPPTIFPIATAPPASTLLPLATRTNLPTSTIPPESTVSPPPTLLINSGQTYPPTILPIATIRPASSIATRTNLPASTIPPESTVSPPATPVIDSGQTYPPTVSPMATIVPASTLPPKLLILHQPFLHHPPTLFRADKHIQQLDLRKKLYSPKRRFPFYL